MENEEIASFFFDVSFQRAFWTVVLSAHSVSSTADGSFVPKTLETCLTAWDHVCSRNKELRITYLLCKILKS